MKIKSLFAFVILLSGLALGQGGTATNVRHGANLPANCQNQIFIKDGDGQYVCGNTANAWSRIDSNGNIVNAADQTGTTWADKVVTSYGLATCSSGCTIVVPDTIAGNGASTTPVIPSNVQLVFPGNADFTLCNMTVGRFSKIYMHGAQLKISGSGCTAINQTTQALFQVNDKFILDGVRIDCNSQTNSTGVIYGAGTAQATSSNLSIKNCTNIGLDLEGAQFSENYNTNLFNNTTGLVIHSVNPGGGGNSNTFYGLKGGSNSVGILIYADTSIGQGANYFINPSLLSSTTTGLCAFGNTFAVDTHWYGGAPEATGGGPSTLTVQGKTCKQGTIYGSLADFYMNDLSIADATSDPWSILETSSHIYFSNPRGYGKQVGVLVQSDATSGASIDGPMSAMGTVQNVIDWPSTIQTVSFAKMYGGPKLWYTPIVSNVFTGNSQTPAFADINGASSQVTAYDPVYGIVSTVTFAGSAGSKNTNRANFGGQGTSIATIDDFLVSFHVKSSVNALIACGDFSQNNSFQNVNLIAGQWTRVVLEEGVIAANAGIIPLCNAADSAGATVSFTGLEIGAAPTSTSAQIQLFSVIMRGAVNPNDNFNLYQTKASGNNSQAINLFTTLAGGSAALMDQVQIQDQCGSGINPTCQLFFTHPAGTSGFFGFNMAAANTTWIGGSISNSQLSLNSNMSIVMNGAGVIFGSGSKAAMGTYAIQNAALPNAGTTGTTTAHLVKLTGAPSTTVIAGTSDTAGIIGICNSTCTTTGTPIITQTGIDACTFDGATTAGHYVQISSAVAGDCHDTGAATPPVSGEIIGRVLSTNGAGGNFNILLILKDQ